MAAAGPIAFIESTTHTKIFDEDANRCLLLGTDESREQTERIVMAQARAATGASGNVDVVIARHFALQRMLRRTRVNIPFAEAIARAIPKERQEARRAMPHILPTIRSVSLVYQRQRSAGPLVHGSVISATLQDYVVSAEAALGPDGPRS